MSASWILAVDFGTSNTAAAHQDEVSGAVQALPLSHGGFLMSSAVYVSSAHQVDVGDVAANRGSADPSRFVTAPKRLLSLNQTTVQAGELDVPAYALVAAVLRAVLIKAQTQHAGRPPARLALTHPENWSPEQVRVLTDAAAEIGYPAQLVDTVSEPHAAAHYYAWAVTVPAGRPIAVFDFGGGTLDVAVLAAEHGSFRVIAARGDNALGGRNFDAAIRRWVESELSEANPDLLDRLRNASPHDTQALEAAIRTAKELLSEAPSATITVAVDGTRETLMLTRAEFERLVESGVNRGVELARSVFSAAGLARDPQHPNALHAIYLTGGSSRIPLVHRRLQELGPIATLDDPKTVVARGAIRAANSTRSAPATPPTLAAAAHPVPESSPRDGARPRSRRRTGLVVAAAVTIAAAAAIAATAVILGGDDTGSRTAASTSASPETTGEATPSEITSSDNKPTAPSDGSTIPAEFEGTWRGSATGKGLAGEDLTETVVITLKAGQSRGVWESPEANDPGCRKGSLALTSASAGQLHFDVTDLGGICAGYESIGSAPKVTVAKAGQDLAYSAALPLNITSKGTLKK